MKRLDIYDPAMCCSTGVCGPQVDPLLVARGRGEVPFIREVVEKLSKRTAIVPWIAEEPVEPEKLGNSSTPFNSTRNRI